MILTLPVAQSIYSSVVGTSEDDGTSTASECSYGSDDSDTSVELVTLQVANRELFAATGASVSTPHEWAAAVAENPDFNTQGDDIGASMDDVSDLGDAAAYLVEEKAAGGTCQYVNWVDHELYATLSACSLGRDGTSIEAAQLQSVASTINEVLPAG